MPFPPDGAAINPNAAFFPSLMSLPLGMGYFCRLIATDMVQRTPATMAHRMNYLRIIYIMLNNLGLVASLIWLYVTDTWDKLAKYAARWSFGHSPQIGTIYRVRIVGFRCV